MLKLLVASSLVVSALARCPNDCSGKGACGEHDLCTCYPGYQALDCSERTCLFGRAWGDTPDANDQAHDYSECSSNGICDRKTGECTCNDGFTGDACRYAACPNGCNGHGTCEYINEIATDSSIQYGSVSDRSYDLWDAEKSRFCKCDGYWSGPDCSERMCPRGNDPLTTMTPDKIGGNTAEVQEVQTIDIRAALHQDDLGTYVGLGGDFTLSYVDAYNQEWTTRPIRVATKIQQTKTAASTWTAEITIANIGGDGGSNIESLITDTQRRFNMFELYDTIKVHGAGYTPDALSQYGVATITKIDCSHELTLAGVRVDKPCVMFVSPKLVETNLATAELIISLVNTDTGEIGVKRMLSELPNQVIPSITVDETIGFDSNSYKVTFSDSANSGDQHMLTCKVASCDTDGCQPRKKAIKGLYRISTASTGTAVNSVTSAVAGTFTNIQLGTVELINQEGSTDDSTAIVTSKTVTALTFDANYLTAMVNNEKQTLYQIQDFTDDSIGAVTGGQKAQALATVTGLGVNTQVITVTFVVAPATGNKITAGSGFSTTIIQAGDTISVKCAGAGATNDGYYKVTLTAATGYTVEGSVTAVGVGVSCVIKKVVDSPCTVTETQKGTSELLDCSRHGNCDSQTGLCACFPGYTGEACSTQTVLV